MPSQVLDDFIDDCFLSRDDICKFNIYRSRKYEHRVNPIASKLIAFKQKNDLSKSLLNTDLDSNLDRSTSSEVSQ